MTQLAIAIRMAMAEENQYCQSGFFSRLKEKTKTEHGKCNIGRKGLKAHFNGERQR
jgi:hypothetical protein